MINPNYINQSLVPIALQSTSFRSSRPQFIYNCPSALYLCFSLDFIQFHKDFILYQTKSLSSCVAPRMNRQQNACSAVDATKSRGDARARFFSLCNVALVFFSNRFFFFSSSFVVAKLPLLLFVINKLSNLQEAERLTTFGDLCAVSLSVCLSVCISFCLCLSLSLRDK